MAKLYTVDEITERTTITRRGQVEKVYRVTATTTSGTSFTVEIPDPDFNDEKVAQVLTEKASLLERIKKL